MTDDTLTLFISSLALLVSVGTAWLTFFFRGTVQMTAPSMIAFGYDAAGPERLSIPKVMVRSLLFSTGERGHAVETLFLELQHKHTSRNFSVWGIHVQSLERGGGMFVPKSGVTAWHHFLPRPDEPPFCFEEGNYDFAVFARVHGLRRPVRVWTGSVSLTDLAVPKQEPAAEQVWFDQDPISGTYTGRLEQRSTAR